MAASDNEFRRMVMYFWTEKEDPTRYTAWSEPRCRELMPEFYAAWKAYIEARNALNMVALGTALVVFKGEYEIKNRT